MTKQEAFEHFQEWHLDTYFVPFNQHTAAHQDRKEGFVAGMLDGIARAEAKTAQISISRAKS